MRIHEVRAVCRCAKCRGALRLIALQFTAESEDDQEQLETMLAGVKQGEGTVIEEGSADQATITAWAKAQKSHLN